VKRWLGLALVCSFVVMLWPVSGTIVSKGATTSYTIYVHPYYVDTQQYGSGIPVTLKDITTGASVGKVSDNSGTVQFSIPGDLNGNYNDGDDLVLELEAPSDYHGSPMLIYGNSIWDGKSILLCMYRQNFGTSYVGYMTGSNGRGSGGLKSPKTVYFTPTGYHVFKATWTHTDSRSGTHRMSFEIRCYKWSGNTPVEVGRAMNISTINNGPSTVDPEVWLYLYRDIHGSGSYSFRLLIFDLDGANPTTPVWDSGYSGKWTVGVTGGG